MKDYEFKKETQATISSSQNFDIDRQVLKTLTMLGGYHKPFR